MKTVTKADWVAALRSGHYKQTTGSLRRENSFGVHYCCLGVACVLAELPLPEGKETWEVAYPTQADLFPDRYIANKYLPIGLAAMLGLTPEQEGALAYLNDTARLSFDGIADRIEADQIGTIAV